MQRFRRLVDADSARPDQLFKGDFIDGHAYVGLYASKYFTKRGMCSPRTVRAKRVLRY